MTKITDFVQYEPKKENRFIIEFGEPFKIPNYVIHRTTRPIMISLDTWADMVFSMYDPISPSTSQALMDGIRELRKRDDKTIEVKIYILDPVGEKVEEWIIKGIVDNINFGVLDYKNDEPVSIDLYFKVINAILNY